MSHGPIRINLKELQDIGLLFERERKYYYVEVSDFPKEKDLLSIIEELDRKYQRVSEEKKHRGQ